MITDIVKRIAELQKEYSSSNTTEMSERGLLIRRELPAELKKYADQFEAALGDYGKDIGFEGSDGIGRKTQAPWVRIYSKELSPSATTGFYIVIHFSVDGKWCYVTVGCGATRWDNNKGDLVKSSKEALEAKVNWAKTVLSVSGVNLSRFSDQIAIGSLHPLPQLFEKATAICRCHAVTTISDSELISSITEALTYLAIIYDSYGQLGDLPQSLVAVIEVESVVNPNKKNPSSRQGYGLSTSERKSVEHRAMEITQEYLECHGYEVKDVSSSASFDFLASKEGQEIKVEVKGTTTDFVDSVLMTANEIKLHASSDQSTALAIVSGIRFVERGDDAKTTGGQLEFLYPWEISEWELIPTAYIVKRPEKIDNKAQRRLRASGAGEL